MPSEPFRTVRLVDLGNTRVVVDKDKNVVERYDYYPFGLVSRSTINNPELVFGALAKSNPGHEGRAINC